MAATTWVHNKMAKAEKHLQLHITPGVSMERSPGCPLPEGKAGREGHSSAPGGCHCREEQPGEQRLSSRDCFINTVWFLAAAPASCGSRQVRAGRLGAAGLQGWHHHGDQRGHPRGGARASLIFSGRYRMEEKGEDGY